MQTAKTETHEIPSFLGGKLLIGRGRAADYRALERFHYRAGSPATFAGVWIVRYSPETAFASPCEDEQVVAAAVLSYPTIACRARERALKLERMDPKSRVRWVNRNVRTMSRVAVHPQFRSLGLASALVRHLLQHSTTRYTEALAVMGRAHPFFEKGGMQLIEHDPNEPAKPCYYLFDRTAKSGTTGKSTCPCHTRIDLP